VVIVISASNSASDSASSFRFRFRNGLRLWNWFRCRIRFRLSYNYCLFLLNGWFFYHTLFCDPLFLNLPLGETGKGYQKNQHEKSILQGIVSIRESTSSLLCSEISAIPVSSSSIQYLSISSRLQLFWCSL
jgi:hypothetical protein